MAYSENRLDNGVVERKYYGLDSSGIIKMYYNNKIIKFPIKEVNLCNEKNIVFSINMLKFNLFLCLKKVILRVKCSGSLVKHDLEVFIGKTLNGDKLTKIGIMEKDKKGYYKFDLTSIIDKKLNSKINIFITTKARVKISTLFAFYDSQVEFIIQYYDPNYLIINNKKEIIKFNSKTNIEVYKDIGLCLLKRKILKIGDLIDLYIISNNIINVKYQFNYNQRIFGGVNNYKYIDSYGITHLFKLDENSFTSYHDVTGGNLKMKSNSDFTYIVYNKKETYTFNRNGYLVKYNNNLGTIYLVYNDENKIIKIMDNYLNVVSIEYEDNAMRIVNNMNERIVILKEERDDLILIDGNATVFKYDSKNNLKNITTTSNVLDIYFDKGGRLRKLEKSK